jgi:hypothetical protein
MPVQHELKKGRGNDYGGGCCCCCGWDKAIRLYIAWICLVFFSFPEARLPVLADTPSLSFASNWYASYVVVYFSMNFCVLFLTFAGQGIAILFHVHFYT